MKFSEQEPTNPNLPPIAQVPEPYGKDILISKEDYLILINRLNDFADNTFTFGESILKKMEESGINNKLKNTADKIANKSAELSNNFIQKTRDSFTQINQNSKVAQLKEKYTDKISTFGGKLWGVSFIFYQLFSSLERQIIHSNPHLWLNLCLSYRLTLQ